MMFPFPLASLLRALALCGICLATAQSIAAAPLDDAEAALRGGAPARAEALLAKTTPQTKADQQRHDWALALSLLRQNRAAEAIAPLERLVADHPNETRVRLELARAYFLTGQDAAARRQFDFARAGHLAPGEAQAINSYLSQIDARKSSESYFRFAIVPETNAARRTAAETITLGQRQFRLNNRAASGTGIQLGFGHIRTPTLSPGLRARLGVHVEGRFYPDRSLSTLFARAEAGLERSLDRDAIVAGGLFVDARWQGFRPYTVGLGGYLSYSSIVGRGDGLGQGGFGRLSARLEVMSLRYPDFPFSDGVQTTLSVDYRHIVSPKLALSLGVVLDRTGVVAVSESSKSASLTLGASYAFDGGMVVSGDITGRKIRRDGPSALFGVARKDTQTSVTLRVHYTKMQFRGFSPTLELTAEKRKSNIPLYDYKNIGLSIGLARRF